MCLDLDNIQKRFEFSYSNKVRICRVTGAAIVTLGVPQSTPLKRNLDPRFTRENGPNRNNEPSHVPSLW
jgi:hypothetical protein